MLGGISLWHRYMPGVWRKSFATIQSRQKERTEILYKMAYTDSSYTLGDFGRSLFICLVGLKISWRIISIEKHPMQKQPFWKMQVERMVWCSKASCCNSTAWYIPLPGTEKSRFCQKICFCTQSSRCSQENYCNKENRKENRKEKNNNADNDQGFCKIWCFAEALFRILLRLLPIDWCQLLFGQPAGICSKFNEYFCLCPQTSISNHFQRCLFIAIFPAFGDRYGYSKITCFLKK